MTRTELADRVAQAIALIGTPRPCCQACGKPLDVLCREEDTHSPHSAAKAMGIGVHNVYRAMKKAKMEIPE